MFVSNLKIKNYRLFNANDNFQIGNFNIPDNENRGSGLTVLVGENGCGKTTILDAIALTMLEYKLESFNITDMNDIKEITEIITESNDKFNVNGIFPKSNFDAIGFKFVGKVRNRSNKSMLLSPIVSEQYYISTNPDKPSENSPDLRVSVQSNFGGKRYNDTDILYLDKNRLFQTRSGTYNSTRFDRIMNDFNFQYNKNTNSIENLNEDLNKKIKLNKIENTYLEDAINKFDEISGYKVKLDFINNYLPFSNATFTVNQENNMQIELSDLGSGYEMLFSLIYSYYLSKQNKRNLIILIDEPELHLHPMLQEKFVSFLLEVSKTSQIIITTHSPLLIKQLAYNTKVKNIILTKNKNIKDFEKRKLTYISGNETNYIAFNLPTEEYHNELYEELKLRYGETMGIRAFDNTFFVQAKKEKAEYPEKGIENSVTLHTFVRNQIHHRAENGYLLLENLKKSIEIMRNYL